MEGLWKLIEDEARAIAAYYDFLDDVKRHGDGTGVLAGQRDDTTPVVDIIQRIVEDERDHLNALMMLYDSMTKNKPATDMTEFTRKAIADFREQSKLIK